MASGRPSVDADDHFIPSFSLFFFKKKKTSDVLPGIRKKSSVQGYLNICLMEKLTLDSKRNGHDVGHRSVLYLSLSKASLLLAGPVFTSQLGPISSRNFIFSSAEQHSQRRSISALAKAITRSSFSSQPSSLKPFLSLYFSLALSLSVFPPLLALLVVAFSLHSLRQLVPIHTGPRCSHLRPQLGNWNKNNEENTIPPGLDGLLHNRWIPLALPRRYFLLIECIKN
ncbi:uncharacterized protein ARB_02761 [Trichophyton benhamiae CBS 112371]|uniref:Uncharacterized protein n=1 Tax=Arthroderma benhamiae (strain ATCC MYA-4681 / CBS 112371) TaxID=663331 RepID=D4B2S8_ARTBC|nr:uncharacterized protein ARB_02761 [Trichophyton benhamiae CBS 112371]EFE30389.1 hypothetical protein ARB_02761 [Trichophyton benhamiae CBS 112371]